MITLLDAARQALDALTHVIGMRHLSRVGKAEVAAEDLRIAIKEAGKAEPKVWCSLTPSGKVAHFDGKPMLMVGPVGNEHHTAPLYAHPQRLPLTMRQIKRCVDDFKSQYQHGGTTFDDFDALGFVRAVERAHGIGGSNG